jgi:hypothetical protein
VKFKLDEKPSPSLAALFAAGGHEAHSVVQQALGCQPDECVIKLSMQSVRAAEKQRPPRLEPVTRDPESDKALSP